MHGVASVVNSRDRHVAGMILDGKVRSCDGNNDRAHFRMNVAEKEANAGSVKSRGIGRTPFVETEIEALAVEEREDVMKKWVLVGKLHRGAHLDDEDMGLEAFVALS